MAKFKEHRFLDNDDLYDLSCYISDLADLDVYDEDNYMCVKNRVRHINAILFTDTFYSTFYDVADIPVMKYKTIFDKKEEEDEKNS